MNKNIFDTGIGLDSSFLDDVYGSDMETAITIFEQYLQDLPADISQIRESFDSSDKKRFVSLIHKKKVAFSYVGLTDVTTKLTEMETNCAAADDLSGFRNELESVLTRISSSTEGIKEILLRLKQQE